jgi:hypothetical protein
MVPLQNEEESMQGIQDMIPNHPESGFWFGLVNCYCSQLHDVSDTPSKLF